MISNDAADALSQRIKILHWQGDGFLPDFRIHLQIP
jgi:hypothetical protein